MIRMCWLHIQHTLKILDFDLDSSFMISPYAALFILTGDCVTGKGAIITGASWVAGTILDFFFLTVKLSILQCLPK